MAKDKEPVSRQAKAEDTALHEASQRRIQRLEGQKAQRKKEFDADVAGIDRQIAAEKERAAQ